MPFPVRGSGGGGGGGGLHFRNPADTFTGANLAACRTARDAYFALPANATALPQFQGDQSLAIVLNPTSTTDNTFETYSPGQVGMTYDNTQWLERTGAVQGNRGSAGTAGAAGTAGTMGLPGLTGAPGTPGGQGTATPPTIIVNSIGYTAHGAVTVGSWRDYDLLQFIYFDGSTYFPVIPIATSALRLANASGKQALLAFEQNTSFNIYSTDDSDAITISFHNSGPAIGANSTMTVIGWFAGSNGSDGMDGAAGADGMNGAAGADGMNGAAGVDGMNGMQGERGAAGTGAGLSVQDEGGAEATIQTLNVVGAAAQMSVVGDVGTLTVTGGGGPTPTHTEQYLAGKATQDFGAGDFTGAQGVAYASGSHTATVPTVIGNVYAAVARISTDPEPTYADVNGQGINQFSDFTKQVAEIDINGDMYEIWVSDYAVFATGDRVEFR